ncbi:hypothetical protein ACFO9E_00315 [Streptomyces maoxianensis]|uniref:Uncharacterized protein n=1 Tax=Streptomyces maoxianensis TaxID=1459942 RepID=A0ABV9FW79_9ACTN
MQRWRQAWDEGAPGALRSPRQQLACCESDARRYALASRSVSRSTRSSVPKRPSTPAGAHRRIHCSASRTSLVLGVSAHGASLQQIERDEVSRLATGQLQHAPRTAVHTLLQRTEIELALGVDDHLAVQDNLPPARRPRRRSRGTPRSDRVR